MQNIYSWRVAYIATKQQKIMSAFENLGAIDSDSVSGIQEMDDDEKNTILRPYLFYSPYYALSQIERLPMELALDITLTLSEVDPKLTDDELLKLEESNNIYVIEYLKLINIAERDRNKILHAMNSFSDYFSHQVV